MTNFIVTNTNDSGESSLRQAILNANANPDADTITFEGSVFTDATPDTITLTSGELVITNALTINGLGASNLSISGNNTSAVFDVNDGNNSNQIAVAINGLTITDVFAPFSGFQVVAPIQSREDLTINNSTISGNTAGYGGIHNIGALLTINNSTISGNSGSTATIFTTGTATITNSTIAGNTTNGGIGGIFNLGTVAITNSTISGNSGAIGGIRNDGPPTSTVTVTNSTISGNTATGGGGGISNSANLILIDSTITNNTADSDNNGSGDGGGVINFGTATAKNTIIAGNFDFGNQAPDIARAVTGNANNLIGSLTGASGTIGTGSDITFASAGITNINQVLASLANNGGATQTHALVSGSAAINAGDNALIPSGVTTDQRGITRIIGSTVDIGAYESPFIPPVATNDTATTDENTVVNINVLGNDTDANGDSLSVTKVNGNSVTVSTPITLASGALLTLNANGTFVYNPNGRFESLPVGATRTDSFNYTISDGNGGTDTATVNLTISGVNDAPVISNPITPSVTEDTSTPDLTSRVTLRISDVDSGDQRLFSTTVTSATGNLGSLSFIANAVGIPFTVGSFRYTVANSAVQFLGAGQTKAETFTVQSSDGTATQDIVITINGVNDAPTGSPTAILSNTPEDTAITITAANLLAGFSDVDAGDTLSVTNLTATNGALVNNLNGTYTFTPTANFNGAVNLTYDVTDGTATLAGQSNSFSVTPVNDAPVAVNDSVSTFFGTTVNIPVTTLLANDTDIDSTGLSITGVSAASNGTAVLNNNGTASNTADDFVSFTPNLLFSGNASFNYTLSDGSFTDTATVTVAVGVSINGGSGADNLLGTTGNDIINGGNSNDTIYGGAGDDSLFGENGNDVLYGDGLMDGGAGNDTLNGGNGDDTLYGGGGSDRLFGGNGNDLLYGGLSSDILTGNNGNDTFAFTAGEGADTVTDFSDGNDLIGLYGGLSFGQLSFSGSNIKVTSTNEILATLTGINTTTLTAADFVTL